jgi:hypothetical protein
MRPRRLEFKASWPGGGLPISRPAAAGLSPVLGPAHGCRGLVPSGPVTTAAAVVVDAAGSSSSHDSLRHDLLMTH